jgi:hypothetical protein
MSPPGVAISVWCSQPGVFLIAKNLFLIFAKHKSSEFPPKVYCYKQKKILYFTKKYIFCKSKYSVFCKNPNLLKAKFVLFCKLFSEKLK